MNKIQLFEHIVYELKKWFMDYNEINSDDEFNEVNDFSFLKIIKLHFLVSAINSHNDDALLRNFNFYAMPYGPVETDIYSKIKESYKFNGFNMTNFRSNFSEESIENNINLKLAQDINNSISIIRKIEPRLINADASSLVELTHLWSSWQETYREALDEGFYSREIPVEKIINDRKILNLDLV